MSTAVPHQPYSVWAPEAETVTLVFVPTRPGELRGTESTTDQQLPFGHTWPVSHRVPLHRADTDSGWWVPAVVDLEQALAELQERTGQSDPGYGYSLNGGHPFPDPRARRLPDTVHGPARRNTAGASASIGAPASSPLRTPRHQGLRGAVIYELHVGTFTPEGTLDASISYLDHLVELGITHVELMPVNSFSGARNWGYDGVGWYAVDESYGGPEAYRRFIAACHQAGLGVIQDVVYNHFGPDGNYLPQFGPYLNPTETGWGQSLNLDGPGSDEVRRYILDNARMFLGEYGVDGLRLDAVHALHDTRALHLLEELAALADELTEISGVEKFMVAESDLNDPHLLNARPGGYGLHGQWSDDFHHAVHVAVTGETQGYYHDFAPLSALAKVYNHGFFHNGTYSSFRQRHHGRPLLKHTPAHALVVSIQNHDQVGNRAAGDRPSATLTETQLAQSAALMLTGPYTPMLFMGEEWGATTPFAFFSAHRDPDLGRAVTEGRRREFARMEWSHDEVPDPQSEQTFIDSTLDWAELTDPQRPDHARLLEFYRSLIRFRAEHPELTDADRSTTFAEVDESHSWLRLDRGVTTPDQPGSVVVLAALGEHPLLVPPELTDAGYQIVLSYGLTDTAIAPGGVAILTR